MKVFIKKLSGKQFEIEVNPEHTVADLKNNIESVEGYPAANQVLVHQGQLLKDLTILEEDNNVAENSVIVMMVSAKPRTSVTCATRTPQLLPPTMALSENEFGQAASHLVAGTNLDSVKAASDGTMAVNRPDNPVRATELPAIPPNGSNGPNARPLNLFPQGLSTSAGATCNLDFLRNSRHFRTFRAMVLTNSRTLRPMFKEVKKHNPQLIRLIAEHLSEYFHLMREPCQGRGNPFLRLRLSRTWTRKDFSAIRRLRRIGFNRLIVKEAFFVCNKNENKAANYLVNLKRGFKDYHP